MKTESFFQKLDRLEKAGNRGGSNNVNEGLGSSTMDCLDESFDTLSDGMDDKLTRSATYFEFDPVEIERDEFYTFRPDVNFKPGMTYEIKDLDLTKSGVCRPPKRVEFEVNTEEVPKKADFRNVRLLANFITEAGIIIKRSKCQSSEEGCEGDQNSPRFWSNAFHYYGNQILCFQGKLWRIEMGITIMNLMTAV